MNRKHQASVTEDSSRVKYHGPPCLTQYGYIRRTVLTISLTLRQHFKHLKAYQTHPKGTVKMGRYPKSSMKKKSKALKESGLLRFAKSACKEPVSTRDSDKYDPEREGAPSSVQLTQAMVGSAPSDPQVPEIADEVVVETSSCPANQIVINVEDVSQVISKLEDAVSAINATQSRDSMCQTEGTMPKFRDIMDQIVDQKTESSKLLDSLKTMSRRWPVINIPMISLNNGRSMTRMLLDEEKCLKLAQDLIRGVDIEALAHFIRAAVCTYYCVHAQHSTQHCGSCQYWLSILAAKGLLKPNGTYKYNNDDILSNASTFLSTGLMLCTITETEHEEHEDEDSDADTIDVGSHDEAEIRNMEIGAEEENFPEALNLSVKQGEAAVNEEQSRPQAEDHAAETPVTQAAAWPPAAPAPGGVGVHHLPQLPPSRPLGPVTLELRHVALPMPQLAPVSTSPVTPMDMALPPARAPVVQTPEQQRPPIMENLIIRRPVRPEQPLLPPRVTDSGAPANHRGGPWIVVTGSNACPLLYNPSSHPSLVLGHGEEDRIRRETQEAIRALRRIRGSAVWDSVSEDYGPINKMIAYIHPLQPVCPVNEWYHRRSLPILEHPSPISVSFSNRGNNLNANHMDVRVRNKMIFVCGYILTPDMPRLWKAFNFKLILHYGRYLARQRFTEGWNFAPEFVKHFQHQQISAAAMFLNLDIFENLPQNLIMAHAQHGVRSLLDIMNGAFPLSDPYNIPPRWHLPVCPGHGPVVIS